MSKPLPVKKVNPTKAKLKKLIPSILMIIFAYYVFPEFMITAQIGTLILLYVMPLLTLGAALWYGLKLPVSPLYSLIVAASFLPANYIFFGGAAWGYCISFLVISLIGSYFGVFLLKYKAKQDAKLALEKSARKKVIDESMGSIKKDTDSSKNHHSHKKHHHKSSEN